MIWGSLLIHRLRQILCAALRRAALSVVWICLLANLWRAPIAWIHVHQANGTSESLSSLQSQHVAGFHHSETNRTKDAWHVHLAFLDEIVRGGGSPIPSDEQDDPVVPSSVCPLPHADSFATAASDREKLAHLSVSVDRPALMLHPTTRCEQTHESAAAPQDSVAVLCVARC